MLYGLSSAPISRMTNSINIIDLFSGPGGLGEGFSGYVTIRGKKQIRPFSIIMSVEKEQSAHRTLQLRAFFRKFAPSKVPEEYYQYLRNPDLCPRDELFRLYPTEASEAIFETLEQPRALGSEDDRLIFTELASLKKKHKGPWLVIGGPPCQAYSLVGRSRNAGISGYKAENDNRHFLYKEYLKVLERIRPEAFVMENVKGILSSAVHGQKIFPQLLKDLRNPVKAVSNKPGPDYHIYSFVSEPDDFDFVDGPTYKCGSEFIIRCENYGIPQMRHRVILLGVRSDLDRIPEQLIPAHRLVPVNTIIGRLPPLRSGLSKETDGNKEWEIAIQSIRNELAKNLSAHGDRGLASYISKLPLKENSHHGRGGDFIYSSVNGFIQGYRGPLKEWIHDPRLGGFLNHQTRGHIRQDLMRYLWCSSFTHFTKRSKHPSPKSSEFPEFLSPNHKNWKSGHFADRFRVQAAGLPATTITSHISKDGHYFIHYDPAQCRSLTVREAARIQTFPDNYFFEGNRTQQFVQVGNAVPPYLAHQIAEVVYRLIQ